MAGTGRGIAEKETKRGRERTEVQSQQEGQDPVWPQGSEGTDAELKTDRQLLLRCLLHHLCPWGWGTQANEGQRQRRIPVFTVSTGLACLSPGKMWVTSGELPAPALGASPLRWGSLHGLRMEKACPICLWLGLCQSLHQFQGAAPPPCIFERWGTNAPTPVAMSVMGDQRRPSHGHSPEAERLEGHRTVNSIHPRILGGPSKAKDKGSWCVLGRHWAKAPVRHLSISPPRPSSQFDAPFLAELAV